MYAIDSPSEVYHLLTPALDYTLCGLTVVPIVIDRPAYSSSLYLISNKPTDRELCEVCQSQSRKPISKGE
jgi:hypothetical protein